MKCGFCGVEGHTIAKCKAEGVEEEKKKRKSDPKYIEKQEKLAKKREEKRREENQRLNIGNEKKGLHQPVIRPGHIEEALQDECETVEGVLNNVLPDSYLQKILGIINENKYSQILTYIDYHKP